MRKGTCRFSLALSPACRTRAHFHPALRVEPALVQSVPAGGNSCGISSVWFSGPDAFRKESPETDPPGSGIVVRNGVGSASCDVRFPIRAERQVSRKLDCPSRESVFGSVGRQQWQPALLVRLLNSIGARPGCGHSGRPAGRAGLERAGGCHRRGGGAALMACPLTRTAKLVLDRCVRRA
jgi:hypothetical protein